MEIMRESEHWEDTSTQLKWKKLSDLALAGGDVTTAVECARAAKDFGGQLLVATCYGDKAALAELVTAAKEAGRANIAFMGLFLLGRVEECIDLLIETKRIPEAAFLARTYLPSHVSRVVKLWREDLTRVSERAAQALADPSDYANLFPDLSWALQAEAMFLAQRDNTIPAAAYEQAKINLDINVIQALKAVASSEQANDAPVAAVDAPPATPTPASPTRSTGPSTPAPVASPPASPMKALSSPAAAATPVAPSTPASVSAATPVASAAPPTPVAGTPPSTPAPPSSPVKSVQAAPVSPPPVPTPSASTPAPSPAPTPAPAPAANDGLDDELDDLLEGVDAPDLDADDDLNFDDLDDEWEE